MSISAVLTVRRVKKQFKNAFSKAKQDKATKVIANEIKDQIVKRTRLGYGINERGEQVRLQPLAKNTVDQRKGKKRFFTNRQTDQIFATDSSSENRKAKIKPKLSRFTSPARSNLTATGKLLSSIIAKVSGGKIILEIPERAHNPNMYGENSSDPITLAELARVHQEGARIVHPSGKVIVIPKRRFFGVTSSERKKILRFFRRLILKSL